MWWYRDTKKSPQAAPGARGRRTAARAATPAPAAPARPPLADVFARVLADRPRDPEAWLAMSLLVDSRIELTDGTVSDGASWLDAERTLGAAVGGDEPLRLYNRFSRDFGDGYSAREDLPAAHAKALTRLRQALAALDAVRSVGPRTPREAAASSR